MSDTQKGTESVPRELLERVTNPESEVAGRQARMELCDLLDRLAEQQDGPVGWQFYQDGKWWNGDDRIKDHRDNTEAFGYRTRNVYAHPANQEVKSPDPITAFAFEVITGSYEGGLLDAYDIQEMAVKHGLLTIVETNEPCAPDGCQCAEYGFPAECYRHTVVMKNAVAKLNGIKE